MSELAVTRAQSKFRSRLSVSELAISREARILPGYMGVFGIHLWTGMGEFISITKGALGRPQPAKTSLEQCQEVIRRGV
jgi:hypothetical protein